MGSKQPRWHRADGPAADDADRDLSTRTETQPRTVEDGLCTADARGSVWALVVLVAIWTAFAGIAITLYAARYVDGSAVPFTHHALAALALAVLVVPETWRARTGLPPESARIGKVAIVAGAVLVFAVYHPGHLLHVAFVLLLLATALFGVFLGLLAPLPESLRRLVPVLLVATLHFLMFAYYVVLFAGGEAWNQVVSRELLIAYLRQFPDLVATLPVDPLLAYATLAGTYLAFAGAYLAASRRIAAALLALGRTAAARFAASSLAARLRHVTVTVCVLSLPAAALWMQQEAFADFKDPLLTTIFVEQDRVDHRTMPFKPDLAAVALDQRVAAAYRAPPSLDAKTLVIITVDALRADQMGVYGHERANTPFLTRMFEQGKLARFDNAYAACTESFCGLLAIHTARSWHQLGLLNFSLADVLKRLGYRNEFLLSGDHTGFYGLRAFYGDNIDLYRDGSQSGGYMNDDAQVLVWLEQLTPRDGEPRFLYIHLMTPHILGMRHPQYRKWSNSTFNLQSLKDVRAAATAYADNYHNGVLQSDAMIEQIFERLRAQGFLDDAIVVITADHGEMLGEEGRFGHGGPPLDAAIRVPLLIYDSAGFGYPPRELVSVIDIAPTLLDRIGAPIPAHWAGESLVGQRARRFASAQSGRHHVVLGRFGHELYKYHYDERTRVERLFNLSRDPLERENLSLKDHQSVAEALREQARPQLLAAQARQ